MKARIWVLATILVATISGAFWFTPSTAQDTLEDRVIALEDRVSALETQAAASPASGLENSQPETYTITGTFELTGTPLEDFASVAILGCFGMGGYEDITVGAQVRVTDEAGEILAIGALEPDPSVVSDSDKCIFVFSVDVPEAEFYTISIGGDRRGGITFSFDDLVEQDWKVEVSLG